MTLQEFKNTYNGKIVDTDGAYGGQCMDLMHKYIVDVLGLPLSLFAAPTACEAYKNANDPRFDKIANSPTNIPSAGDIVFWNTTVGSAGHVAIFLEGDANSFKSFDQNWPTGSTCHVQDHTYKGVAGWLSPMAKVDPTEFARIKNLLADNERTVLEKQSKIDTLNDEVVRLNGEITDLKSQVTTLNNKVILLTKAQEQDAVEDNDLLVKNIELEHKLAEKQKPIEQEVKPLQDHALSLQNALDGLIYQRAPKRTQSLLTRIIDKLFTWFA